MKSNNDWGRLGMSFSEWQECLFEEIMLIPIRNGLSKPKAIRGYGKKMVNMGEIFKHDRIYDIEMDRVPTTVNEFTNSRLEKGDLLFARQSLVWEGAGKCSIIMEAHEDLVYESHIIRVRLQQKEVDPLFYFYYFKSHQGKNNIRSIVEQVAAAGIRGSDLKKLKVPKPPYDEQKNIAETLSILDDKIELNNRINKTIEEMAQTIFKSWFIDFEPFQDGEFEDSELGRIPKGWRVESLDNVADFLNGLAMQKYRPESDEFLPVIKIKELNQGFTDDKSDKVSVNIPRKYIIADGDVVFSWSGTLMVKIWTGGRGGLNQHLFKVTSEKYNTWMYYLWTLSHLEELKGIAKDKATTMGHIKRSHLTDSKVLIPKNADIETMNDIMNPIFNQLIVTKIQNRTLEKLRDSLLPKLMSGEVRVPIEEVQ